MHCYHFLCDNSFQIPVEKKNDVKHMHKHSVVQCSAYNCISTQSEGFVFYRSNHYRKLPIYQTCLGSFQYNQLYILEETPAENSVHNQKPYKAMEPCLCGHSWLCTKMLLFYDVLHMW